MVRPNERHAVSSSPVRIRRSAPFRLTWRFLLACLVALTLAAGLAATGAASGSALTSAALNSCPETESSSTLRPYTDSWASMRLCDAEHINSTAVSKPRTRRSPLTVAFHPRVPVLGRLAVVQGKMKSSGAGLASLQLARGHRWVNVAKARFAGGAYRIRYTPQVAGTSTVRVVLTVKRPRNVRVSNPLQVRVRAAFQPPVPAPTPSPSAPPIASPATTVQGAVYAWGYAHSGGLGNGTIEMTTQLPVVVHGLSDVVSVASSGQSNESVFAVRRDGTVWAWGAGGYGQLGSGRVASQQALPVQVIGLTNIVAVAGAERTGYALRSDGTVWAWGHGSDGGLGDGSGTGDETLIQRTPVQVSGLTDVTAIAAGSESGYALRSDGSVWSWGGGADGALGLGDSYSRYVPERIAGLPHVTAIAAAADGYGYSYNGYALASDGTIWSWGSGLYGLLGTGSTKDFQFTPVQVSAEAEFTALAATPQNGYALRGDGTVWSWGYGTKGGLGNGSTIETQTTLVQVTGLSGVTSIGGGYALRSDGTVWAWGQGLAFAPMQMAGLAGVTAIAQGSGALRYAIAPASSAEVNPPPPPPYVSPIQRTPGPPAAPIAG